MSQSVPGPYRTAQRRQVCPPPPQRNGSRVALAVAVVALGSCAAPPETEPFGRAFGPVVAVVPPATDGPPLESAPNRYLISLKVPRANLAEFADSIVPIFGSTKGRVFSAIGVLEMANLSTDAVEALRRNPAVLAVEPPGEFTINGQQSLTFPSQWGLDFIDQKTFTPNAVFGFYYAGAGTDIYIVDTGIQCSHVEFATGVMNCWGASFTANWAWPDPFTDQNGHGTGMASIAAGGTVGIARNATLHSIKVGINSTLYEPDVIAGINWVAQNATVAAVANVSLTPTNGTLSTAFRNAINNLALAGVTVVLAAGNGGADQIGDDTQNLGFCTLHPAVIVVSAVAVNGFKPGYANFGPCVDIFAPGFGLRAAMPGFGQGYADNFGGTSSATAVVSGVAATALQHQPSATVNRIFEQVVGSSTVGVMNSTSLGVGSPNHFVNAYHLYYDYITGPTQIVSSNPQTATWSVAPSGGDGTFSFAWSASVNYGAWTLVGTSQNYTRTIPRFAAYTLNLKVTVSSAGLSYETPGPAYGVTITCGGC